MSSQYQERQTSRKFRPICFASMLLALLGVAAIVFFIITAQAASNEDANATSSSGQTAGTDTSFTMTEPVDSPAGVDDTGMPLVSGVPKQQYPEPIDSPAHEDGYVASGSPTSADTDIPLTSGEPKKQYQVLEMVQHDSTSFTQGLSYGTDGTLYETTGLNGQSKIRRINPETFQVELSKDIPYQYFGEGSTFYIDKDGNDRIIHITWQSQTGFIYDAATLEKISDFTYTTTPAAHEGWGITYLKESEEFIVSDGSQYLYFWNRDTLSETRRITVTRVDGSKQDQLNELEFIDGLVCCNIWQSDEIICVDPQTGDAVKEIDLSDLYPKAERQAAGANVLNGIADGGDHILLTGKLWDRMYKVTF